MMLLSEAERDRLLVFLTAELARARRRRGLRLNVVEATPRCRSAGTRWPSTWT
jgi:urease gamma subunit